jgi:glutaminyl-tRNA synthetase
VRVLEWHLRKHLDEVAPRSFAVLDPIKLKINGMADGQV